MKLTHAVFLGLKVSVYIVTSGANHFLSACIHLCGLLESLCFLGPVICIMDEVDQLESRTYRNRTSGAQ